MNHLFQHLFFFQLKSLPLLFVLLLSQIYPKSQILTVVIEGGGVAVGVLSAGVCT